MDEKQSRIIDLIVQSEHTSIFFIDLVRFKYRS